VLACDNVSLSGLTEFNRSPPSACRCYLNGVVALRFSAGTPHRQDGAFDKGFHRPKLGQQFPVHVERAGQSRDKQDRNNAMEKWSFEKFNAAPAK